MARFTNFATLTYTGGTTDSNVVTGELLETLTMTKTALEGSYSTGETVTYVLSVVNSGTAAVADLTVTDDLGGYAFDTGTLYPLSYVADSLRFFVDGVLQPSPTVTAGPPLTVSGLSVPAGGSAILVYEARITEFAPLGADGAITNTATLTGGGLVNPVIASETVAAESRVDLSIRKSLSPATVTENGQLTYTFVIENSGTQAATEADRVVLTDTFNPRLTGLRVTYNGAAWTEGVNYTYDPATGVFATLPGQITVPAATVTQNPDGSWTATPGAATVVVTGTV